MCSIRTPFTLVWDGMMLLLIFVPIHEDSFFGMVLTLRFIRFHTRVAVRHMTHIKPVLGRRGFSDGQTASQ